ncbi:MAG: GH25 family lysozyme, partial [Oscillospiraceae bacterium]
HRTSVAKAFCETVRNAGYKAGVYASKSWFYNQLEYSQVAPYSIWVAHYASATDFVHRYDIWQYTGSGTCAGIGGAVDLNIGYSAY